MAIVLSRDESPVFQLAEHALDDIAASDERLSMARPPLAQVFGVGGAA